MAALRKGTLFIPNFLQCRHRVNIKHPRIKHIDRRLFEAVTQPIILEKLVDPYENCSRLKEKKKVELKENPFEKYLVRQCHEVFTSNKILLAFQPYSVKERSFEGIRIQLLRKGFHIYKWYPEVIEKAIAGTKWQNISPLVIPKTLFIGSKESELADLVAVVKKIPELIMLGGFVEDRLLNHAEIVRYATLPSMPQLLGELTSILSSGASKTSSYLTHHQQTLSRCLDHYAKNQNQEPKS